jgi:hypothetical protein
MRSVVVKLVVVYPLLWRPLWIDALKVLFSFPVGTVEVACWMFVATQLKTVLALIVITLWEVALLVNCIYCY